ncbi:hypothetical protein VTN77DRAFT_385 [Rasamsonia byssochlamydoides]|uniref:uncharacterized protein n=1 Tax=Rasamsonia byssochlamydoides TaxID=89139 RepID=UPI00374356AD
MKNKWGKVCIFTSSVVGFRVLLSCTYGVCTVTPIRQSNPRSHQFLLLPTTSYYHYWILPSIVNYYYFCSLDNSLVRHNYSQLKFECTVCMYIPPYLSPSPHGRRSSEPNYRTFAI